MPNEDVAIKAKRLIEGIRNSTVSPPDACRELFNNTTLDVSRDPLARELLRRGLEIESSLNLTSDLAEIETIADQILARIS